MEELLKKEWLLTNGLGGYASGTVSGANTRHYHGLLVAAFQPPTDRKVLVAKIEERVVLEDDFFELSTNQYPNAIHPNGSQYLQNFQVVPWPLWHYTTKRWHLEKSVRMVQGKNTTLVRYRNTGPRTFVLELHPLCAYSDYHETFHEATRFDFFTQYNADSLITYPTYGAKPLKTVWTSGQFTEARAWFKNIRLTKSYGRGQAASCDYYRLGYLTKTLRPKEQLIVCFTAEDGDPPKALHTLWTAQRRKVERLASDSKSKFYTDLLRSGDQFLVQRKSTGSNSIIAGYHWFTDWGRDTMIAMRGLTIATGRKVLSKSILSTFFSSIDQGMIPDRFPDNGDQAIEYNSIDATLWLFVATYEYYQAFKDVNFIKKHLGALREILEWHISGTRYNIHVTDKGFLYGGEKDKQLTWMDAIVEGKVITPRIGCPVEVNALWYNALSIYVHLCKELTRIPDQKYLDIMLRFEMNFSKMFLNSEGTLHDVILPDGLSEASFRPNQLYCLSLPFPLLPYERQKLIFEEIRTRLFTPFGLRTLDPNDPNFVGRYQGDQWTRDHAYHQGTVWPYLLYDYYHAYFRIFGTSVKNKKKVLEALRPLMEHFYEHEGLHCISEIFDGLEPKHGKGCIQQAWSVAAIIKLFADYKLYKISPGPL